MIFEPFTVATLSLLIPCVLLLLFFFLKTTFEYLGYKTGFLEGIFVYFCTPMKVMKLLKQMSKDLDSSDLKKANIDLPVEELQDFLNKIDYFSVEAIMKDNNLEVFDLLKYDFYKNRLFLKYFKFNEYLLHKENVKIYFLKQCRKSPSFHRHWEDYLFVRDINNFPTE